MSSDIVAIIRFVAREHGWAIGEHGSMIRDIDLIGVPWTADATTPDVLVGAIIRATGYRALDRLGPPRPGGRRSILLTHLQATYERTEKGTWTPPAIDLSLMPSFAHSLSYLNGGAPPIPEPRQAPNAKITGSVAIRWIALLGFLLLRRKVWK